MCHRFTFGIAFTVLVLVVVAPSAPGQDQQSKTQTVAELPSGVAVVRRSAEMAGGTAAFEKVKTVVMKGKFSISSAKVSGTVLTQYAAPNRAKVTVDLGSLGSTVQYIDGDKGLETAPNAGTRVLDESETRRLLESISMRNAFEAEKVYSSIENKGRTEVDGIACYRLELKRDVKDTADQVFYGVTTGLPIKTIVTRTTPSGTSVIESRVSKYKEFEGIKLATKVVQHIEAIGVTNEIEIESVEINSPLDDSIFMAPSK